MSNNNNSTPSSEPKRQKTAADDDDDATTITHWIAHSDQKNDGNVECLCVGTGRFLRAVLMPILQQHAATSNTALVQPRGRSFLEFMQQQPSNKYPVDTVLRTGEVETEYISCGAAFSWGKVQDKQAFSACLPLMMGSSSGDNNKKKKKNGISILGLGVTEAGLASHETQIMQDLFQLFKNLRDFYEQLGTIPNTPNGKICVIDMDNVPNNGSTIQKHMLILADKEGNEEDKSNKMSMMSMKLFLTERVAFLNTVVDRITSQRMDSPMIPRAEPVPAKALVILDPDGDLPAWFTAMAANGDADADQVKKKYGLVIRSTPAQLETDVALKLRIANGTHTAIAHVMALLKLPMTDSLSPSPNTTATNTSALLLMDYLDSLAQDQILVAASAFVASSVGVANAEMAKEQATAVWEDWRQRLTHPHFGLSTFFITQNGPAKGGIRLTPTITDLVQNCKSNKEDETAMTGIHVSMAFCFAVLLRWLTPSATPANGAPETPDGVFTGWFPEELIQDASKESSSESSSSTTVTYADGLQYNMHEGWYQFRCNCNVVVEKDGAESEINLSECLAKLIVASPSQKQQPAAVFVDAIRAYLVAPTGGNQALIKDTRAFATFSQAVAALYSRMVADDSSSLLAMLQEMKDCKSPYKNGFATDCLVLVDPF